MTTALKKLWKNEYIQTATIISLIVLIFFGFWYGLTLALNNPNPIVVVPTGSMCIPYDGACDGWSHPFARTLHVGDLLVLQGVNPRDLNTNYPNSDIIVFHKPGGDPDELIVHRIVAVKEVDGTLYFQTKGDGNSRRGTAGKWPNTPLPDEYDAFTDNGVQGVSESRVVGKVIMRIPWIGNVVLFMRTPEGLIVVAVLIALLVVIEFVLPVLKKKPASHTESAAKE
jgi:signal peptidase I